MSTHRRPRDREHELKTLPGRRDIGAFAEQFADRLPGGWVACVEDWTRPNAQYELAGFLWDNAHLSWATSEFRLPRAAVLTSYDFTQLLIIDRPLHTDQFLAGALAPLGHDLDHLGDDQAPRGIAVSRRPARAAHAITTRLLPRYYAARRARLGVPTPPSHLPSAAPHRPAIPSSPTDSRRTGPSCR